jgi:hypothetical protein
MGLFNMNRNIGICRFGPQLRHDTSQLISPDANQDEIVPIVGWRSEYPQTPHQNDEDRPDAGRASGVTRCPLAVTNLHTANR